MSLGAAIGWGDFILPSSAAVDRKRLFRLSQRGEPRYSFHLAFLGVYVRFTSRGQRADGGGDLRRDMSDRGATLSRDLRSRTGSLVDLLGVRSAVGPKKSTTLSRINKSDAGLSTFFGGESLGIYFLELKQVLDSFIERVLNFHSFR